MNIHPNYMPKEINNYVFASNYGKGDWESGRIYCKEDIIKRTANWLNVPIEAILVTEFKPEGERDSIHTTYWAAYVAKEFAVEVKSKEALLDFYLNISDND